MSIIVFLFEWGPLIVVTYFPTLSKEFEEVGGVKALVARVQRDLDSGSRGADNKIR